MGIEAWLKGLNQGDSAELLRKLREADRIQKERLMKAERRQKKLERQLAQAGVSAAEDIPYEEAKERIEYITRRMNEIGSSEIVLPDKQEQKKLREEYFKLEQDMEKYSTAL